MARINSFFAFDQDALDLNLMYSTALDLQFESGVSESYKGVTANSAFAVWWGLISDPFVTIFGGNNLTINGNDEITGGTIKLILDGFEEYDPVFDDFSFVPALEILGVSMDAKALYEAVGTPKTSDDLKLIVDALSGNDTFRLSTSGDLARGYVGDDQMFGYGGQDTLYGGNGKDSLFGGNGNDKLFGQAGRDKMLGGNGNDVATGGNGTDRILGEKGDDTLLGGNGTDTLLGGANNDLLKGGAKADLLNGGGGNDRMFGGAGADTFVFTAGKDIIKDYAANDIVRIKSNLLGDGETLSDVDRLEGGNLVLDFGQHELKFDGVGSLADLGTVEFV